MLRPVPPLIGYETPPPAPPTPDGHTMSTDSRSWSSAPRLPTRRMLLAAPDPLSVSGPPARLRAGPILVPSAHPDLAPGPAAPESLSRCPPPVPSPPMLRAERNTLVKEARRVMSGRWMRGDMGRARLRLRLRPGRGGLDVPPSSAVMRGEEGEGQGASKGGAEQGPRRSRAQGSECSCACTRGEAASTWTAMA